MEVRTKPLSTPRVAPSRIPKDAAGVPLPADGPVTQPVVQPERPGGLSPKITTHVAYSIRSQIICLTFAVRHGETSCSFKEKDKQNKTLSWLNSGFFRTSLSAGPTRAGRDPGERVPATGIGCESVQSHVWGTRCFCCCGQ